MKINGWRDRKGGYVEGVWKMVSSLTLGHFVYQGPWVVWNIPFWTQKLFSNICCASITKVLKYAVRKLELRRMQEEYKWDNFISGNMVTGDKAWSYGTVQTWIPLCDSRSPQWMSRKKAVPQKICLSSSWIWAGKKKESNLP